MTLQELQIIVDDIQTKVGVVNGNSRALRSFIDEVSQIINGPYSSTINVDAFVALQTPIYLELLTNLEQSTDALGTDGLN